MLPYLQQRKEDKMEKKHLEKNFTEKKEKKKNDSHFWIKKLADIKEKSIRFIMEGSAKQS